MRCPSFSFGTLSEMSASRGAVLSPLPRRSMTSTPAIPVQAVVASSPRRDSRRARISDPRHLFIAPPPVGDHAARELHERRDTLIEAVDQPELNRAQSQKSDEINRKDAHDHLRGNVREEARQPEQQYVARDAGLDPAQAARGQQAEPAAYVVHGGFE